MSGTPLLGLPGRVWGLVAVDTETSGLHPDEGARVAVISISYYQLGPGGARGPQVTRAYPFDQERWEDKQERPPKMDKRAAPQAQGTLWSLGELFDDPNLDRDAWDELTRWLAGQRLAMHNAKFDLTMLRAGVREAAPGRWTGSGTDLEASVVWDTMLVQRELDPTEPAGLKPTAQRLWGEDERAEQNALKRWLDGRKRYDLVPWDKMEPYAARDADQTLRLWLGQRSRVYGCEVTDGTFRDTDMGIREREGLALRHRTMRTLLRIEQRGIPYHSKRSLQLAAQIRRQMEPLRERLARAWGAEPTVDTAAAYFYDRMGQRPRKTVKNLGGGQTVETESRAVDQVETRAWARAGIPWAVEWGQYRKMQTAVAMWYEGYPALTGPDGRIRTEYKQTRVKSGRMAVGRWQAQAIPKADKGSGIDGVDHIRTLFFDGPGAIEGWAPYNLDLSQAELRVAAHLAHCDRMERMLSEGADLHSATTEAVFKTSKDAVGPAEWKRIRDIAKRLTFGSIFWIGARTFQETLRKQADLEWSLNACQEAVYAWRDTYPEFGDMYYRAMREFEVRKRLQLVSGRWTHLSRWDYPRSGWNRIVQGSLAEFVTEWLNDVEAATRQWHPRGGLVLTVHDSAVLYLPTDVGDVLVPQLAERGGKLATAYFGTPMKVDHERWLPTT